MSLCLDVLCLVYINGCNSKLHTTTCGELVSHASIQDVGTPKPHGHFGFGRIGEDILLGHAPGRDELPGHDFGNQGLKDLVLQILA